MADDIDTDALAQQIVEDAGNPQSTTFDGNSTTFRSLSEQIEALQFLENRQAARSQSPLGRRIKLIRTGDALG